MARSVAILSLLPNLGCRKVQLPLKVDAHEKVTLQSQIFEQIRRMILDGRLRSGDFLPTTRALSEQIGISRNTTLMAYERLMAEGYIQTRPSVGTFVSAEIPETTFVTKSSLLSANVEDADASGHADFPEPHLEHLRAHAIVNPHAHPLVADFWVGRPSPDSFPLKIWSNLIWRRLTTADKVLTEYGDPAGLYELRLAIADHLGPTRGVTTDPEQIIVVGGAQDGLNLVGRMLLGPGSTAVVESPCYQGAAYLLESFGAELHPVPVYEKGLEVEKLPEADGAVAYVTPSHQYPFGVTLTLDRRISLLSWATRLRGYIIEDDYDSDFRFAGSPITALKGLDRGERVFYIGSFSKCMGPALRLGYVVVPRAFTKPAKILKALMNNGQPWLEQAAMADFMNSGGYARHLRRLRQIYLARRNVTLASLKRHFGESDVIGADAGMHLVWRLPGHLPSASDVQAMALAAGVGVYTLNSGAAHHFDSSEESERFLVLGYAALTESEIELGISRLYSTLMPSGSINGHSEKSCLRGMVA